MIRSVVILVLVIIISTTTLVSATPADDVRAKLKLYSGYLNSTGVHLLLQLATATSTSCTADSYSLVCPTSTSPSPNISWVPGSAITGALDKVQIRASGAPQEQVVLGPSRPESLQPLCAFAGMRTKWEATYALTHNDVYAQYLATFDNVVARWPSLSWSCSQDYYPQERPYYVSGASGSKDVVILLDMSRRDSDSTWRISASKRMVESLLKSLSFRDYVAVVPFTSSPTTPSGLVQATRDNIQLLVKKVSDFNSPARAGASLATAIAAANKLLSSARTDGGTTSNCSSFIFVVSSGLNDAITPPLGNVMKGYEDHIVFTIWTFTNTTEASANSRRVRLASLSCGSGGLALQIPNTQSEGNVSRIFDFLAALGPASVVRSSESYTDLFTGEQIVSFSSPVIQNDVDTGVPLLTGVVSQDVALSALLSGNMSAVEFDNILQSESMCQRIDKKAVKEEQSGTVALLQAGECEDLEPPPYNPAWKSYYGGIVTASVLGSFLILIPILLGGSSSESGQKDFQVAAAASTGCFCLFHLIFLSVFWSMVYPDIVVRDTWIKTSFVVDQKPLENPYKCCAKLCDVGTCVTAPVGSPKCSNSLRDLVAGVCDNDWKCCNWRSYSCNCRYVKRCRQVCSSYAREAAALAAAADSTALSPLVELPSSSSSSSWTPGADISVDTATTADSQSRVANGLGKGYRKSSSRKSSYKKSSRKSSYKSSKKSTRSCRTSCSRVRQCDTCRTCTRSTSRYACRIKCGTCYKPTALATGDYQGKSLTRNFGTACGMDDKACVTAFTKAYALGTIHTYYLNPEDPEGDVRSSNKLRPDALGAAIAMGVLAGIPLVVICVWGFYRSGSECRRSINDNREREERRERQEREEKAAREKEEEMAEPLAAGGGLTYDFVDDDKNVSAGNNNNAMSPASSPSPVTGVVYPSAAPVGGSSTMGVGDDIAPPPGGYDFGGGTDTGIAPLGAPVDNGHMANPFEL